MLIDYLDGLVENYKFNLQRLLKRPDLSLVAVNKLTVELHDLTHWKKLTDLLCDYHHQLEIQKSIFTLTEDKKTAPILKHLGQVNANIDDLVMQFSDCLTAMMDEFAIPFTSSDQDFYFWSSQAGRETAYTEADKQGSLNVVAQASIPLFELLLGPATYFKNKKIIQFEAKADAPQFLLRDLLFPDAASPPKDVPDLQPILWASLSRIFAQKAVKAMEKTTTKKPVLHVYLPCQLNRDSNFWRHELPIIQAAQAKQAFEIKYHRYDESQKSWVDTRLENYPVVRMNPMVVSAAHPAADIDLQLKLTEKAADTGKSYQVRAQSVSFNTLHRVAKKWKAFAKDKERSREMSVLLNNICALGKDHRVKNAYQEHSRKRHQDHELVKLICDKMDAASLEGLEKNLIYQKKRNHIKAQLGKMKLSQCIEMNKQRNNMSVSAQLQLLQAYKRHFQYEELIDLYRSTENKHLQDLPQAKVLYVWACNRMADDFKNTGEASDAAAVSEKIKRIMGLLNAAYIVCHNKLATHPHDKTFIFEHARNLEIRSQLKGRLFEAYHQAAKVKTHAKRIGLPQTQPTLDFVLDTYAEALFIHNVSAAGSKYMEYYANLKASETPSEQPQASNRGAGNPVGLLRSTGSQDTHTLMNAKLTFQQVAERTYDLILIDGLDECHVPQILRSAFIAAYNLGDQTKLKRVMDRMARVDMRDSELSYFKHLKVCKPQDNEVVSVSIGSLPEYQTILKAQTTRELAKIKEEDAKSMDPYTTLMHRSYDYRQSLADDAQGQRRAGNLQFGGALPQQVISKDDIHVFSKFVSEKTIGELIPSRETIEIFMRQAANGVNPVLHDFLNQMIVKYYQGGTILQQKLEDSSDVNVVLTMITDIVALNYKLMTNAADLKAVPYRDLDFAMKALCAVLGDESSAKKSTYDSGTSLSIMYAMQVGDCRHHGETTQLLFDIWKRKQLESLVNKLSDPSAFQAFEALEATQLRTIDTKCDRPGHPGEFDYAHTFNMLCTRHADPTKTKFVVYDAFRLNQSPCETQFQIIDGEIEFQAKNDGGHLNRFHFAPYAGDKGKRSEDVYGLSLQGFNGVSEASVTACIFDQERKHQTHEQVKLMVNHEKIKTFKTASMEALWDILVEKDIPFTFDKYDAIPPAELDAISAQLKVKFPTFSQASKAKVDSFIQALHQYQPNLYASLTQPAVSASLLLKIMAHPATKVAAAVLILAGIAGLVFGGLGLAGIAAGLSLLLSSVVIGCGAGSALLGSGLLTAGFFASERMSNMQPGMLPAAAPM